MRSARLLWLDGREPDPRCVTNPDMAQYQLWLAQAQRDHGMISDREMEKMEGATGLMIPHARILWNPFTGEFRTQRIAKHYKTKEYLNADNYNGSHTRLIVTGH